MAARGSRSPEIARNEQPNPLTRILNRDIDPTSKSPFLVAKEELCSFLAPATTGSQRHPAVVSATGNPRQGTSVRGHMYGNPLAEGRFCVQGKAMLWSSSRNVRFPVARDRIEGEPCFEELARQGCFATSIRRTLGPRTQCNESLLGAQRARSLAGFGRVRCSTGGVPETSPANFAFLVGQDVEFAHSLTGLTRSFSAFPKISTLDRRD